MQSRRDQVQAYFFVVGRMVAAVTHGRPDVVATPNRRMSTGTALGVLLGGLIMGIFAIFGIFVPGGNTSWRQPGTIVMDKTTGARFVYLDGQLRPVLNYTSARLASGGSAAGVVSVSSSSLTGTPVGQPIGIPGAPDALPAAKRLDAGPWTVCVTSAAAPGPPTVSLLLGAPPGPALDDGAGVLVVDPQGSIHLVWQGRRHRFADPDALFALGYGGVPPVPVTPTWLNTIPAGRDVDVALPARVGTPGPPLDGRPSVVGRVYEVRNPAIDGAQFYLMRPDGVAPLNATGAALVLAAPATRDAYRGEPVGAVPVGPGAMAGVPVSAGVDLVTGLPPTPPAARTPGRDDALCVRHGTSGDVSVALLPGAAVAAGTVPVGTHTAGTAADRVAIPVGTGVLARERPTPGATPGAAFLITDVGVRYPIADDTVLGALGYPASAVVPLPGELLDLLPLGPVLSTGAALQIQEPRP